MNTINSHKKTDLVLCAGIAAALLAGCATTQLQGRASVGAALVRSEIFPKDLALFDGSLDRKDTGYKLYGAYDPGQKDRFFIEGGYLKMGDATFDGLWEDVTDVGTIETEAIEISAGYRYPFTEKFSAGGQIGAARVDVDEREVYGGEPYSYSVSETVPFGGLTLRYDIDDKWAVSAHYDRYLDVGEVDVTGEGDIDVFGINVDFRFADGNSD